MKFVPIHTTPLNILHEGEFSRSLDPMADVTWEEVYAQRFEGRHEVTDAINQVEKFREVAILANLAEYLMFEREGFPVLNDGTQCTSDNNYPVFLGLEPLQASPSFLVYGGDSFIGPDHLFSNPHYWEKLPFQSRLGRTFIIGIGSNRGLYERRAGLIGPKRIVEKRHKYGEILTIYAPQKQGIAGGSEQDLKQAIDNFDPNNLYVDGEHFELGCRAVEFFKPGCSGVDDAERVPGRKFDYINFWSTARDPKGINYNKYQGKPGYVCTYSNSKRPAL